MASNNHFSGYGNLTFDPEVNRTKSGKAVANLRVAINDKFNKEEVLYLDVTVWEKTAEFAEKYLKKGHRVLVTGKLKTESWDDKTTGEKRSKIVVVAQEVDLLTPKDKGGDAEGGSSEEESAPARPRSQSRRSRRDPEPEEGGGDDDIPF